MPLDALALDDAALAIARDGALRSLAPSIVHAQPPEMGLPAAALGRAVGAPVSSRHWFDIASESIPSRVALAIARAEMQVRLREIAVADDMPALRIAAGPAFGASALGHALGVIRAAGAVVDAFVDAAVTVAGALQLSRGAIVVDLGLHHVGATRVDRQGDDLRRRAALVRRRGGLVSLHDATLRLVAEAMVLRTRFDPLHDAAHEQQLRERLPEALAEADSTGSTKFSIESRGERFEVELSRDQLAEPAAPLFRDLVGMIHELRPAGAALAIVLPAHAQGLPGLRESLGEFAGCELYAAPSGLAARALSATPLDAPEGAGGVRLMRGVPSESFGHVLGDEEIAAARSPFESAFATLPEPPTHLMWSGRALSLRGRTIEIGRAPAQDGLVLPDGLAGVSRQHCTLRDDGEGIVVVDHSRFGTLVNGERVAGRARLRAGDVLRIGDPGVELPLIAVGGEGVAA